MLYYDLHIHSCLSPCAEDDMSPRNVCAMARLKGLDLIALTDHNMAGNLQAFDWAARAEGLLFLPGMELCTKEEVHLLAYFEEVEAALALGAHIRPLMPKRRNKPDVFGRQLLMDHQDRVVGEEDALLIAALDLGLEEACLLVRSLGGVPVPAHIHRGYGLVNVLGFVPPGAGFTALEAAENGEVPAGCLKLVSSDAHSLGMISERVHALDCPASAREALRLLAGSGVKTGYTKR